jgi:hypothetical protein
MNTTAKQIVIAKGAAVATALMLALTGCSQQANPTPSQKVYSFAPTGKSGLAAFAKIAKASCDKANAEGTVQRTTDNAVFVMIPKDKAIKGFSAAYVSGKRSTTSSTKTTHSLPALSQTRLSSTQSRGSM